MPMHAAASATSVRKGNVSRASDTANSNLPGTARYSLAKRVTRGSAKTIPSNTSATVTTASVLTTRLPSRQAASRPWRRR